MVLLHYTSPQYLLTLNQVAQKFLYYFWSDTLDTLDKKKKNDKGDNKNQECRVKFLVHCTFV